MGNTMTAFYINENKQFIMSMLQEFPSLRVKKEIDELVATGQYETVSEAYLTESGFTKEEADSVTLMTARVQAALTIFGMADWVTSLKYCHAKHDHTKTKYTKALNYCGKSAVCLFCAADRARKVVSNEIVGTLASGIGIEVGINPLLTSISQNDPDVRLVIRRPVLDGWNLREDGTHALAYQLLALYDIDKPDKNVCKENVLTEITRMLSPQYSTYLSAISTEKILKYRDYFRGERMFSFRARPKYMSMPAVINARGTQTFI